MPVVRACVRALAGQGREGRGKEEGVKESRIDKTRYRQERATNKKLRPAAWIFRVPGGVIMARGLRGRGECTCTQREKSTRYLSYTVSGAANQEPGLVHPRAHPHHTGIFWPIPSLLLPLRLLFSSSHPPCHASFFTPPP